MLPFTWRYALCTTLFTIAYGGPNAPAAFTLIYLLIIVPWGLFRLGTLLTRRVSERPKIVYVERPAPAPAPPPMPTAEERQKEMERAYQQKLRMIDRAPISDEEKQDAKTAVETEYLRKLEQMPSW